MFKKKNLLTGVELSYIKKEVGEGLATKRQTRKANTPAKETTKRKLVLSSKSSSHDDTTQDQISLTQVFASPKKIPTQKNKRQPEEGMKPKVKKIKLVKYATKLIRPATIPTISNLQLLKWI